MAETENYSEEKLVSGPPPKLDLRKEGVFKPAADSVPQPTQATTMAPKPVAPANDPTPAASPAAASVVAAPKPSGTQIARPTPAKPAGPAIKLGFSAETEVKKPVPTTMAVGGAPKSGGTTSVQKPMPTAVAAAKPVAPAPTVVVGANQAAAKRETSRIPLGAATAIPGTVGATQLPKPAQVAKTPAMATAEIKAEKLVDEKRMTSRISLEAVLMTDADVGKPPADAGGPKTIRLKRPSEAATIKASQRPKITTLEDPTKGGAAPGTLSRTARMETQSEDEGEGDSPTKRKTIKIKRPTQGPTVDAAAAGAEAATGPAMSMAPVAMMEAEDEPMWLFPIAAIAAILVVMVTIYMFLAQAYGPNMSLTELSYGAPGLDLGWPGKIIGQ